VAEVRISRAQSQEKRVERVVLRFEMAMRKGRSLEEMLVEVMVGEEGVEGGA
jgi:hypothetical protein